MLRIFIFLVILINSHATYAILGIEAPPWKRSSGTGGCMDEVGDWDIFTTRYCAEQSPINNFFNPMIRVRAQSCNFWCYGTAKNLTGDGECMMWPGPMVIPLTRICARVANPADPTTNLPADDGYDDTYSLDASGIKQLDSLSYPIGEDGQPIQIQKPKICAYHDPWLLEYLIPLDLMDYNPVKQPNHYGSGLSPVAQAVINILESGGSLADSLASGLVGKVASTTRLSFLNNIVSFAEDVVQWVGKNVFIALIKEFGQLNHFVYERMGCAELMIGPYPPEFPSNIPPPGVSMVVSQVCPNGVTATDDKPCVSSSLNNNVIHNVVRVGFSQPVPLCKSGVQSTQSSPCATISGTITNASAVPPIMYSCSRSSSALCIQNGDDLGNSFHNTSGHFRTIYGIQRGTSITPQNFYNQSTISVSDGQGGQTLQPKYSDCTAATTNACQVVWGVDLGNFVDVVLTFPPTETAYNSNNLVVTGVDSAGTNLSIADPYNHVQSVAAVIARVNDTQYPDSNGLSLDNADVCVFNVDDNSSLIGCVPRAAPPSPTPYSCDPNSPNHAPPNISLRCSSPSNIYPQMILSLAVGNYATSAVLGTSSANATANPAPATINLAGFDYSSYVTDDAMDQQPFSGPNAYDPSTLFGNYLSVDSSGNTVSPITNPQQPFSVDSSTGAKTSNNAVYIGGLDYLNGNYNIGGKYLCVSTSVKTNDVCMSTADGTKNCVLTQLQNPSVVNCNDFFNAISASNSDGPAYSSLRPCTPAEIADTTLTHTPWFTGVQLIEYDTSPKYCYMYQSTVSPLQSLCSISNKPQDRRFPAYNSANPMQVLDDTMYYNLLSSGSDIATLATQANQGMVQCDLYLRQLYNEPYSNIAQCTNAPASGASHIESYVSRYGASNANTLTVNIYGQIDTTQSSSNIAQCASAPASGTSPVVSYTSGSTTLGIYNQIGAHGTVSPCYWPSASTTVTLSYCYWFNKTGSDTSSTCSVNSANITKSNASGTTEPIIVSCAQYLSAATGSTYNGIVDCGVLDTNTNTTAVHGANFSSSTGNVALAVYSYPQTTGTQTTTQYCYKYGTAQCAVSATNTSCAQYLGSMNPSYSGINQCTNNVAPSGVNAPNGAYTLSNDNISLQVYQYQSNNATQFCYTQTPLSCLFAQQDIAALPSQQTANSGGSPTTNNTSGPNYDKSQYGVRSKNEIERGLCVQIPALPQCSSITTANSASGFATWSSANVGDMVTGVCANGYTNPKDGLGNSIALTRYCAANVSDGTAFWAPIAPAHTSCMPPVLFSVYGLNGTTHVNNTDVTIAGSNTITVTTSQLVVELKNPIAHITSFALSLSNGNQFPPTVAYTSGGGNVWINYGFLSMATGGPTGIANYDFTSIMQSLTSLQAVTFETIDGSQATWTVTYNIDNNSQPTGGSGFFGNGRRGL